MKRIISRLELELPELETEYRQYYLKRDIDQVVIGIFLWIFPYLAFAYSDFSILGPVPAFYRLFVLRIVYLLVSLGIVYWLKRNVFHYKAFDRFVLLWLVFTLFWNVMISLAQPQNFISWVLVSLMGIFSFYIFIPNPFYIRIFPPLIYSAYVFLSILLGDHGINPPFIEAMSFSFLMTNLIGVLFSAKFYVSRRQEFLARREEDKIRSELQRLASTDPLTGVLNRRRVLELAGEAFYRYKRYERPFSIMILDLDGFKNLNDTLGHQQGDSVLIQFAGLVSQEKREADAFGRMGGDEFCLVLPETLPNAASALASRIIKRCEDICPGGSALEVYITVSIGISEIRPEDSTLDSLFSRADAALYNAKNNGRSRWEIA